MIIYASNKVTPYVYLLTHKETNQFYIGSRFTKRQKLPSHLDILQYQTSSKTVKKMGFENFDVTIVAEFFCADDAFKFEQQLIEELWSPNCLNKYFIKSGINYYKNTGRTHSIETKQKISNSRKGFSMSSEQKKKLSDAAKGKTQVQLTCPHCGAVGGNVLKRWHFDNCKQI